MLERTIGFFNDNGIAFTSIGVILTFLIGFTTLIVSIHNNKSNYYVNTITQSRIEWINSLRTLISKYISISYISYHRTTSNLFNEDIYESLIELSLKIQLMLNATGKYDKRIIELVQSIKNDYGYLTDLYELINEHGEELANHTLNEEIALNPSFISYLTKNAKKKNIDTKETSCYINNLNETIDLFLEINKSPDDTQAFIDNLYDEPAKIVDRINTNNKYLEKMTQAYLKSEWNRVKQESNGKKYDSKRQDEEIEKVLKQMKYK